MQIARVILYDLVAPLGSNVLGAEDGCSEGNHLEKQEDQVHELVHHSYGSYTVVGVAAQHEGIDGAEHHHKQGLDEYRTSK